MSPPFSTSTHAEDAPAGPDAGSTYHAAEALAAAGNRRGAIALLRRLLARDPNLAYAHALIGFHLYICGNAAEAEAAGRAALAIDPNSAHAHRALGLVLALRMRRRPAALVHLREAVRLSPEDAVFHLELGVLLTAMTHRREARACLEKACALAPANAIVLARAARSLLALRRLDAARAIATRALAADPANSEALGMAARFALLEGRREAARDLARAALAINARHAVALEILVEAEMRGRPAFILWGALRRWSDLSWPRGLLVTLLIMPAMIGVLFLLIWLAVPRWAVVGTGVLVALWIGFGTEVLNYRVGTARRPTKLDRRY